MHVEKIIPFGVVCQVKTEVFPDGKKQEADLKKIVDSAEQEIASAAKAARRQLTAFAADLAVGLARKQIHVDAGTDQALVRNFSTQLGASSDSSGKDRN